ncbi:MAG: hypothetical protein KatS3mg058_2319 [Roseiflexus sp.]|nr:MAG: hypothetical protein KatS3mg058_2319 [Roseiflexus sp.]
MVGRMFRTIFWNMLAIVRLRYVIFTLAFFLFLGFVSAREASERAVLDTGSDRTTVWDALFVAFAGPGLRDTSLVRMLGWFLPHLIVCAMVGDKVWRDLSQHNPVFVVRVGLRLHWWLAQVISVVLATIAYTVLAMAVVLTIAGSMLEWSHPFDTSLVVTEALERPLYANAANITLWMTLLLMTTFCTFTIWQTTLSLITRLPTVITGALALILAFSWILGIDRKSLVPWLPGSQSMILRHDLFAPDVAGFSLVWSLVYNGIAILAAVFIGLFYTINMDFLGE